MMETDNRLPATDNPPQSGANIDVWGAAAKRRRS
jgi:hypothetical protein